MASHTTSYARPTIAALFGLAWPIIVSRSTQVVAGVFDAFMVGYLGEAALAATTTGAANSFNIFIFPMGVVFIVSSFSSQLFGKGDTTGARRFAWYGLAVALATQAVCVIAAIFIDPLLAPFGYAEDVRRLMATYLFIRLLSGGAAIGIEALGNYYSGLGNTRLPMVINVATMAVDIIGNWLFIRGNLGMPALGVAGAALTSSASAVLGFVAFFIIFLREDRRLGKLSFRELREMLRFGIPSGLNWFLDFLAFSFFFNVVLAGLGTTALAAFMGVLQLNTVAFMPAFGLASAGAVLVGQAIGAGVKDDVARTLRMTLAANVIWQVLVGIAYVAFPTTLFSIFVNYDTPEGSALLATGAHMLMLSPLWQIFDATATTYAEGLRAAGDTTFTLWTRVILAWVLFAPGSYISIRYFGHGNTAAVLWVTAYIALLSIVLLWRFRSGAWRNIALTENV